MEMVGMVEWRMWPLRFLSCSPESQACHTLTPPPEDNEDDEDDDNDGDNDCDDVDGGNDDDDDDDDTRFISASSIVPLPSTSYLKIKFYKCWRYQTHFWFDLIPEN